MDDGHPIIRIVIFIILLLIDAAFTGTEVAVSAVNESVLTKKKEEGDSRTVRSFLLDPGALEGLGQSGDVSGEVQLSWQAGENGYADASLSVKVICTYQKMSYSVTTVYTANEEKQGEDGFLSWMRSERR